MNERLTRAELDVLSDLAQEARSADYPMPKEHQRELGELAMRASRSLAAQPQLGRAELTLMAQVTRLLMQTRFSDQAIGVWLESPSPWLDYDRPIDLILASQAQRVMRAARSKTSNAAGEPDTDLSDPVEP